MLVVNAVDATPSRIILDTLLYFELPSTLQFAFDLVFLTCYMSLVLNEHFIGYCQSSWKLIFYLLF